MTAYESSSKSTVKGGRGGRLRKTEACYCLLRLFVLFLCSHNTFAWTWNNPYPRADRFSNIYYLSFNEQPKTLDPAQAYTSNELELIAQIYEPPLEFDYLARPYVVKPLAASVMPEVHFLDKERKPVAEGDPAVAYSVYTIHIKPGIYFQPHPALAATKEQVSLARIFQLSDFRETGTRELVADDYIYQIKRLAAPWTSSPIYGLLSEHIEGFAEYAKSLPEERRGFIDLRRYPLRGVKKLGPYDYEITLLGQYPQFMFWLTMTFFSPIPWEADEFYSRPGMAEKNLSFNWYPIGTGPFMLTENNPNRRIVLSKNPNFRPEYFPTNGSQADKKAGYLQFVGHRLPLVDQVVMTLEKESIPRWNKFIQGYYDAAEITTDSYDNAVQIGADGRFKLSDSMKAKHIRLQSSLEPSLYYLAFNMLDPIVGGYKESARKLRLAIAIAVNFDEKISLFYNGRGQVAQGPIPPGIFGYLSGRQGINPYVFDWTEDRAERKPIEVAKQLLVEAGYPDGVNPSTGEALMLHYDVQETGSPDDRSLFDWIRKQFAKLGIDLDIRSTQYNRFQEKLQTGNAQIFSWSWLADYPDPENFLFLFYGPNAKVAHGGENISNYDNPVYDKLFDLMKNQKNGASRQQTIDEMVDILRHDNPMSFGLHTETLNLKQTWVSPVKLNAMSHNIMKYIAVDVVERDRLQRLWNKPVLWPLFAFLLLLALALIGLISAWRRKERAQAPRVSP